MARKNHITKNYGRRVLSFALAVVTAITSWSVDWNTLHVQADGSSFDGDGGYYEAGQSMYKEYTNETGGYENLTAVTFYVNELSEGATTYSVAVTDGVGETITVSDRVTAPGEYTATFAEGVLIEKDETISVSVTFDKTVTTRSESATGDQIVLTKEQATPPAITPTITCNTTMLAVGQTGFVSGEDPKYHRPISFNSSNTDVLTIDLDGTIRTYSAGTANITAVTNDENDLPSKVVAVTVVDLTAASDALVYNGKDQSPVYNDGTKDLVAGTDYEITGQGKDVGSYTVNINGIDAYAGMATNKTYSIVQADLSDSARVTAPAAGGITVDASTGEVTAVNGAKLGDVDLALGTDFTASAKYKGRTQNGTTYNYKYDVTLTGINNMKGSLVIPDVVAATDAGMLLEEVYSIAIPEDVDIYAGDDEDVIKSQIVVYDRNGNEVEDPGFAYTLSATDKPGVLTITATYDAYYGGEISTTAAIYGKLSDATITLKGANAGEGNWIYAGGAVEPIVEVTYGATKLVKDKDYELSFTGNTKAGQAYVYITGLGEYKGEESKDFRIVPDLNEATIKVGGKEANKGNNFASAYSATYTGNQIKPTVVVTLNGQKLTYGTNYSIDWDSGNTTNAGEASFVVTTTGVKYGTQSKRVTFTIEPKSLTSGEVSPITTAYTYDKTEKKPDSMTLTVDGKPLEKDTDYELSYSNNVNAGTAFVVFTGKGNYKDTKSESFTIKPNTITASNTQLHFPDCSYTGNPVEPKPDIVKVDDVDLEYGVDYTVTYRNNINKSTDAKPAYGTIVGQGNYSGSLEASFRVVPRTIVGEQISYKINGSIELSYSDVNNETHSKELPDSTAQVYNGYERRLNVQVIDGDTVLKEGTHYTLTYANNIEAGVKNAASVTIRGKGNYADTGTVTFYYSVNKCPLTERRISYNETGIIGEDDNSIVVKDSNRTSSMTRPGGVLIKGTDYTIDWGTDGNKAGANKTVKLIGAGNYTGERVITYNQGTDISDGDILFYDRVLGKPVPSVDEEHPYQVDGKQAYDITYLGESGLSTADKEISSTNEMNAIGPRVYVAANDSGLKIGTDFKLTYHVLEGNGSDAGSVVQVVANANGVGTEYYGQIVGYYRIVPAVISTTDNHYSYTIQFENEAEQMPAATGANAGKFEKSYTYNANAITPEFGLIYHPMDNNAIPAVNMAPMNLTKGVDFDYNPPTVDARHPNSAPQVGTITGKGNYKGTAEIVYNVSEASLANATITPDSTYTMDYTGEACTPDWKVVYDGERLEEGVDYTVTYSPNNVNEGTVTATFTGKGKFKDTNSATYQIVRRMLTQETTEIVVPAKSRKYTGAPIELQDGEVVVKYKGEVLQYGVDYTIKEEAESNINPGKAVFTVKGKGIYGDDGTAKGSFDIYLDLEETGKYSVEGLNVAGNNEFVYYHDKDSNTNKVKFRNTTTELTKESIKIYTTDTHNNKHYILDADPEAFAYTTDNLSQPTTNAVITIHGAGANKYCVGTLAIKNNKVFIDVNLLKWRGLSEYYAYDGSEKKPVPSVYYGDTLLTPGVDFKPRWYAEGDDFTTVRYAGSQDNKRLFWIEGAGRFVGGATKDDAERLGEYEIRYDLSKAVADPWENSYIYGSAPAEGQPVNLKVIKNDGSKEPINVACYTSPAQYNSSKGSGATFNDAGAEITATVTPNEYSFNTWTGTYKITGIDVKNNLTFDIVGGPFTYTGSQITPTINNVKIKGTNKVLDESEYTVTYQNNVDAGTASVIVSGTGNYSGSTTQTFEIGKKSITDDTIQAEFPKVTYTGSVIRPEELKGFVLRDTSNGKVLRAGTDQDFTFAVTSGKNAGTEAGTVKVTMNATGNYTGTDVVFKYDISKLNLSDASLSVSESAAEYTGDPIPISIKLTMTVNGVTELSATDMEAMYQVTYNGQNQVRDIGKYNIEIMPKSGQEDNVEGSNSAVFEVTGRWIGTSDHHLFEDAKHNYTLTFDGTDYSEELHTDYINGSPVEPVVYLKDETKNHILTSDEYDVTYENNTDATDSAKVIISGKGNYYGTVEKTFTIGKALPANAVLLSEEVNQGLVYNAAEQKPKKVTVKDGTKVLAPSSYTISYSDDLTNVGTKTVTVTPKGTSGYYGTATATYDITKRRVKDEELEIVPNLQKDQYGYYADFTGAAINPDVTVSVKINGKSVTLTKDTDYTVSYSDSNTNASPEPEKSNSYETGGIFVSLMGNNYQPLTKTQHFRIRGGAFSDTNTVIHVIYEDTANQCYNYDGTEKTPVLEVEQYLENGDKITLAETDYEILSQENNVNPGEATVTIKGKNNFVGTATTTYAIKADLATAFDVEGNSCDVPKQLYTGTTLTPAVEAVIGGTTLKKDKDFSIGNVQVIEYDDDGNPSKGSVDITGMNQYYGSCSKEFDITTNLDDIVLIFNGLDDVYYNGKAQIQKGFTVYDPSGNAVQYDENRVTYTSDKDGSACVAAGTVTVKIPIYIGTLHKDVETSYQIKPAPIGSARYTGGANTTYTGNALKPSVTLYYGNDTLVEGRDYEIVYANNINPTSDHNSAGTVPEPATITITGKGNYTGERHAQFQIYPEHMRQVSARAAGANGVIVSWNRLDHVSGYRVDVMTTESSKPFKTVTVNNANTTSATISGLSEGTTYSFRAYSFVKVGSTFYYGLLSSITTSTGIYTPNIQTVSGERSRATISWQPTGNNAMYEIYRCDSPNGTYRIIARTGIGISNFTDTGVVRGRTYYYKIRACRFPNEFGEYSDYSAVTVK